MAVLAFTAQDYIKTYLEGFMEPFVADYNPKTKQNAIMEQIQLGVSICSLVSIHH